MLFTSIEFLVFFPVVVCIYFLLTNPLRWLHLLVASYYEILRMWKLQEVANRPFSPALMAAYASGFPPDSQLGLQGSEGRDAGVSPDNRRLLNAIGESSAMQSVRCFVSALSAALFSTSLATGCGGGDESAQRAKAPAAPTVTSAPPTVAAVAPKNEYGGAINNAPHFESATGWGAGYAKAVGKGAGVVVGPGPDAPNVFAQGFAARSSERFKIVARAASASDAPAKGRLQINWHAADAKYLATSSRVIDVTGTEQVFDLEVVAPAGAAKGILYVVPHGASDTVRYTEMSLLKGK